jgi:hypothetical protein
MIAVSYAVLLSIFMAQGATLVTHFIQIVPDSISTAAAIVKIEIKILCSNIMVTNYFTKAYIFFFHELPMDALSVSRPHGVG